MGVVPSHELPNQLMSLTVHGHEIVLVPLDRRYFNDSNKGLKESFVRMRNEPSLRYTDFATDEPKAWNPADVQRTAEDLARQVVEDGVDGDDDAEVKEVAQDHSDPNAQPDSQSEQRPSSGAAASPLAGRRRSRRGGKNRSGARSGGIMGITTARYTMADLDQIISDSDNHFLPPDELPDVILPLISEKPTTETAEKPFLGLVRDASMGAPDSLDATLNLGGFISHQSSEFICGKDDKFVSRTASEAEIKPAKPECSSPPKMRISKFTPLRPTPCAVCLVVKAPEGREELSRRRRRGRRKNKVGKNGVSGAEEVKACAENGQSTSPPGGAAERHHIDAVRLFGRHLMVVGFVGCFDRHVHVGTTCHRSILHRNQRSMSLIASAQAAALAESSQGFPVGKCEGNEDSAAQDREGKSTNTMNTTTTTTTATTTPTAATATETEKVTEKVVTFCGSVTGEGDDAESPTAADAEATANGTVKSGTTPEESLGTNSPDQRPVGKGIPIPKVAGDSGLKVSFEVGLVRNQLPDHFLLHVLVLASTTLYSQYVQLCLRHCPADSRKIEESFHDLLLPLQLSCEVDWNNYSMMTFLESHLALAFAECARRRSENKRIDRKMEKSRLQERVASAGGSTSTVGVCLGSSPVNAAAGASLSSAAMTTATIHTPTTGNTSPSAAAAAAVAAAAAATSAGVGGGVSSSQDLPAQEKSDPEPQLEDALAALDLLGGFNRSTVPQKQRPLFVRHDPRFSLFETSEGRYGVEMHLSGVSFGRCARYLSSFAQPHSISGHYLHIQEDPVKIQGLSEQTYNWKSTQHSKSYLGGPLLTQMIRQRLTLLRSETQRGRDYILKEMIERKEEVAELAKAEQLKKSQQQQQQRAGGTGNVNAESLLISGHAAATEISLAGLARPADLAPLCSDMEAWGFGAAGAEGRVRSSTTPLEAGWMSQDSTGMRHIYGSGNDSFSAAWLDDALKDQLTTPVHSDAEEDDTNRIVIQSLIKNHSDELRVIDDSGKLATPETVDTAEKHPLGSHRPKRDQGVRSQSSSGTEDEDFDEDEEEDDDDVDEEDDEDVEDDDDDESADVDNQNMSKTIDVSTGKADAAEKSSLSGFHKRSASKADDEKGERVRVGKREKSALEKERNSAKDLLVGKNGVWRIHLQEADGRSWALFNSELVGTIPVYIEPRHILEYEAKTGRVNPAAVLAQAPDHNTLRIVTNQVTSVVGMAAQPGVKLNMMEAASSIVIGVPPGRVGGAGVDGMRNVGGHPVNGMPLLPNVGVPPGMQNMGTPGFHGGVAPMMMPMPYGAAVPPPKFPGHQTALPPTMNMPKSAQANPPPFPYPYPGVPGIGGFALDQNVLAAANAGKMDSNSNSNSGSSASLGAGLPPSPFGNPMNPPLADSKRQHELEMFQSQQLQHFRQQQLMQQQILLQQQQQQRQHHQHQHQQHFQPQQQQQSPSRHHHHHQPAAIQPQFFMAPNRQMMMAPGQSPQQQMSPSGAPPGCVLAMVNGMPMYVLQPNTLNQHSPGTPQGPSANGAAGTPPLMHSPMNHVNSPSGSANRSKPSTPSVQQQQQMPLNNSLPDEATALAGLNPTQLTALLNAYSQQQQQQQQLQQQQQFQQQQQQQLVMQMLQSGQFGASSSSSSNSMNESVLQAVRAAQMYQQYQQQQQQQQQMILNQLSALSPAQQAALLAQLSGGISAGAGGGGGPASMQSNGFSTPHQMQHSQPSNSTFLQNAMNLANLTGGSQ